MNRLSYSLRRITFKHLPHCNTVYSTTNSRFYSNVTTENIDLTALIPQVITVNASTTNTSLKDHNLLNQRDAHDISLKSLLAANLHLGHSTTLWNPSMLPYIYGTRHGTHIINLEHTLTHLRRAAAFIRQVAMSNGNIVFLGTKPAIHKITVDAALLGNAYYITQWVGGTITNKERTLRHSTGFDPSKVLQNTAGFNSIVEFVERGGKESSELDSSIVSKHSKKDSKSGIQSTLKGFGTKHVQGKTSHSDQAFTRSSTSNTRQPHVHTPDVLVVLDYINNLWAVREANVAHIPVIAVCDTNTDPTLVQYPIPANDDSIAGIKLIAGVLSAASRDGATTRSIALNRNQKPHYN
ncbi:hypothetical protein BDV3_002198 [Batrachochytrium dendrobatidis]|uniref:Ribosomal protein S2 n=1 Tax=Batrachochytrium dendrobatidis (strain JEL423) TaxID=403673 RepID=A0A177WUH2_BATDL|nr:hypothetical protein O5D80_007100 [Batrachochytrium dendrobatidis]KAK5664666.1 hypothetical protein QVD99_008217 [Batrachochytrium dendrobatidis]KAK5664674.1 hypothetical protein QVD99_008223 [Batrachochytrium dendrobatidis]OAJ43758.1 ribosomal protein S2 [Batrachochytrium dendrobatidis JEL423]